MSMNGKKQPIVCHWCPRMATGWVVATRARSAEEAKALAEAGQGEKYPACNIHQGLAEIQSDQPRPIPGG